MEIKTLKNAIDRLAYTTSKGNKSNETDVIALNKIIDFVNNANEQVINQNKLYCKLYADALIKDFRYYNNIEISNVQLNKKLDESIELKIMKLAFELQTDYLTDYFYKKGLKDEWVGILFKKDVVCLESLKNHFNQNKDNILMVNAENKEIYSKIDFKEFQEVCNFWTYEKTLELFKTNAALSFNKFKN